MSQSETGPARTGVEDPVLEVREVSVTYDMFRGTSRVLDGVNLDVERGEVLGIVGESGSGKSMLANAMLDAVPNPGRTSGKVQYYPPGGDESFDVLQIDNEHLRQIRWEQISMLFQGAMSSFNPVMQIRDHFRETLSSHGYDVEEGLTRARGLISDLYMDPIRVLNAYPHELSGGMRQRTLIALSLVLEPDVLIMDEPTAALDLLMQRSILNLLNELKEQYDLTLVFITHDLPLVADLADRIGVMYAFELAEIGPKERILEQPAHPYTRLLLRSTPALDVSTEEMQSIEGSSPDPVDVPSGCSFHPRCPLATAECAETDPPFESVADNHKVACIHWEQSEDRISLAYESAGQSTARGSETIPSTPGGDLLTMEDVRVEFDQRAGLFENIFGNPDVLTAVDEVDLEIAEKDVVALVGESGCGKTTLGKAAIGLQRPTDGDVKYRGQDIWEAKDEQGVKLPFVGDRSEEDVSIPFEEIRRSLQIIHQDPGSAINPNKTVLSSLSKPLKRWHSQMDHNERETRIYALLEEVGLTPPQAYAKRYPHQLSGGEKQRVALIRALLMNPDLILADEAISALDVSLRVDMMDLFLDLQETFDTSYLFISHDLSNARYLAEKAGGRIAVMYLGEIVEIGPVESVIGNPEHPYTIVLRWATPNLRDTEGDMEPPVRDIDIPDATNKPSGCRFHTRCPEAREICASVEPDHFETDDKKKVACFRADADHEYWESEPLYEDDAA